MHTQPQKPQTPKPQHRRPMPDPVASIDLEAPAWVHILDDRSLGGVRRFIEALGAHPSCRGFVHQLVRPEEAAEALGPGTVAIVHEPSSWGLLPRLLSWRARAPVVLIEHHYSAGFERFNVDNPQRFHWLLRLAYAAASRVVSISDGQAAWMLENRLVREKKLRRIPPFVDLTPFLELPDREPGKRPVFGVFGRFCPQKGIDLLLRALRQAPDLDLELIIGGYGPDEQALHQLAEADPRVRFVGRVNDPPAFVESCDAIIVPSRWEPYGLVCLEARAAGRPVLVHAVDGLTEQAIGCGLALAPEPQNLAAGLASFCHDRAPHWPEQGRRSARASVASSAWRWIELIAELTPRVGAFASTQRLPAPDSGNAAA